MGCILSGLTLDRRFAVLVAALGLACGTPPGKLVPHPWPRIPDSWTDVPRPKELTTDGPTLTAIAGEFRYSAYNVLPGVVSLRVSRGPHDPRPSAALAPGVAATLRGTRSTIEATLLEAVAHMQFATADPARDPALHRTWRWIRVMEPDEVIVGMGERPGSMQQRDRRVVFWNSDNFAYGPDALRLYQSIPFWISIKRGRARGYFVDNSHRMGVDVGFRHEHLLEVVASGGDFQVYLIDGPTPREVVERFAELTGRPPLPPKWSLGYQQCRWSYGTRDRVLEVARGFRESKIPCDVIYLDIDHMDGFRSLTVDPARFPDFPGMIAELRALGFQVVTIVDPGVKVDPEWPLYAEGMSRGYFVKDARGRAYVGKVWAGDSVFPDFTREDVRAWWGSQHAPFVKAGVAGFWNDMNEPSVFDGPDKTMPEDLVHGGFGGGTHARFHNLYGMFMAQATREGVQALRPESRPFVLTRASFAGGQRYAATWTGDNRALWTDLRHSIPMTLNLGLCGVPFAGPDIGGFDTGMEGGGSPYDECTPELYARWLEFGALLPLARSHTIRDSMDREPFAFGEAFTNVNRASIERRYRLMPTLYTLAEEAHRRGVPLVRPLFWNDASDAESLRVEDQFFLGDHLLVAPVVEPGATGREVYFPPGVWYPFDPNEVVHASPVVGPRRARVEAPLGKLPLFARAGGIVASEPVRQHTSQFPSDTLYLDAFVGIGNFTLFEDAGEGHGHLDREFARTYFEVTMRRRNCVLSAAPRQGEWNPRRRVVARLHTPDGIVETSYEDDGAGREILTAEVKPAEAP